MPGGSGTPPTPPPFFFFNSKLAKIEELIKFFYPDYMSLVATEEKALTIPLP